MALQLMVAASSPNIVSEQNALAQTLMNLSSPATATAVASANSSPTLAKLSAPLSPRSAQEQVDAVPSSTGSQQFIVHHHAHPIHPQAHHPQHLMRDYDGGLPLQMLHHQQQQLQQNLPHHHQRPQGSPSAEGGAASASPKTSPLFSAVTSAMAPESSLSPNKFYKNKRKTYPVRSPQMEQRQTPPGVIFQFPSTFVKEGSEHLSPKLNVIFYPDPAALSSVSPKLSTQSPPPVAHYNRSNMAQTASTSRSRVSARQKVTSSRLKGLAIGGLSDTLRSKRRLRDADDSDEEIEDDEYDGETPDEDLQAAADLAGLAGERKQRQPAAKKRKVDDPEAAERKAARKAAALKKAREEMETPTTDNDRPKRVRVPRARADDNEGGDDEDEEVSVDEREESPRREGGAEKPAKVAKSSGGKKCASCGTTNTPYWRDGWHQCTLCNACGIRYQKYRMRCPNCIYIPRKDETSDTKCRRCGHQMSMK